MSVLETASKSGKKIEPSGSLYILWAGKSDTV